MIQPGKLTRHTSRLSDRGETGDPAALPFPGERPARHPAGERPARHRAPHARNGRPSGDGMAESPWWPPALAPGRRGESRLRHGGSRTVASQITRLATQASALAGLLSPGREHRSLWWCSGIGYERQPDQECRNDDGAAVCREGRVEQRDSLDSSRHWIRFASPEACSPRRRGTAREWRRAQGSRFCRCAVGWSEIGEGRVLAAA
jgi:hypothetical protein